MIVESRLYLYFFFLFISIFIFIFVNRIIFYRDTNDIISFHLDIYININIFFKLSIFEYKSI